MVEAVANFDFDSCVFIILVGEMTCVFTLIEYLGFMWSSVVTDLLNLLYIFDGDFKLNNEILQFSDIRFSLDFKVRRCG